MYTRHEHTSLHIDCKGEMVLSILGLIYSPHSHTPELYTGNTNITKENYTKTDTTYSTFRRMLDSGLAEQKPQDQIYANRIKAGLEMAALGVGHFSG